MACRMMDGPCVESTNPRLAGTCVRCGRQMGPGGVQAQEALRVPSEAVDQGETAPSEPPPPPDWYLNAPPEGPSPLLEAHALVHGDRQESYGHPADDFARTAALWSALFGWDVEAKDVALAMACLKLSRLIATPDHRDSVVDLAGYAEAYSLVLDC